VNDTPQDFTVGETHQEKSPLALRKRQCGKLRDQRGGGATKEQAQRECHSPFETAVAD
jgi:hypothetical protein